MSARPIVDGQRQPKVAPQKLSLIDPDLQLAGLPLVFEGLDLREWLEADQWERTVPMDLSEVPR
jgi:hypothetical protein